MELKQTLKVGEKETEKTYAKRDQFAPEILYFSDCILKDRQPEPSGWEGLADVRIIEALYRSARTGKPVSISKRPSAPDPPPSCPKAGRSQSPRPRRDSG